MKVVVGASSFGDTNSEVIDILKSKGIEIVKNPYGRKMNQEEIIKHLQGADGLLAGLEPLNEEVFIQCPNLKAIARIGIGMDNVDQEAAARYKIKVSNTPEGPTSAVAEMTLTALLSICHNLIDANDDIHNGIWKKRMGKSIQGMKVLVIGYGHIGKKTAELLERLGAEISIYDKYISEVSVPSLEQGVAQADVITLHASGKEEIISQELIQQMKDGVIILNSARGGLVNEQALYDALKSNKVAAFWGDALWEEPYEGIIKECKNAILTPHICTYTTSCRTSMEKQAVENLLGDLGL
ncbi:hydroxyacid dehydrogenase [Schaedlerella arabinosiphila]|uniref:Hydroxyacid dehydrogenase n=1 Tax=Schaedlerella arabinosiphila TaxID=2044587 RepID=A0A3R8R7G1_9FIRM|nr:NAD(P)-dependent oxidoreductase [Schaedlerella arabinosiphila]RRK33737.1 hydroxyacid dehydrogenase [Schaedlerella arabinosiphila]